MLGYYRAHHTTMFYTLLNAYYLTTSLINGNITLRLQHQNLKSRGITFELDEFENLLIHLRHISLVERGERFVEHTPLHATLITSFRSGNLTIQQRRVRNGRMQTSKIVMPHSALSSLIENGSKMVASEEIKAHLAPPIRSISAKRRVSIYTFALLSAN